MFAKLLQNVRTSHPLVHSITNRVTINDCANVLLACGASPIMADDPGEAADVTAGCDALTLNLGTLDQRRIPAMLAAGRRANELGHPVVLDPVGAGASPLRTETALRLLREGKPTAVRGNMSELRALARAGGGAHGVDADRADRVTEETLDRAADFVRQFAARAGVIASVTGPIDLVSDGTRVFCIRNGHPMMGLVTGTGCQLSVLTAAFLAANPDRPLEAAAGAVCALGLCGELAHGRLTGPEGSGTYRVYLMDAVSRLTPEQLEKGANYEVR